MIHFHHHDQWSSLDGCGSAELHAKTAADLGMSALGQTNHGTLRGAMHHMRACNKHKIMPICGIEAYFKPQRDDPEIDRPHHICLYAKDLRGWHSLMRLSTEAYESGYHRGYACTDLDLMRKHSEGVACSTACLSSYLAELILSQRIEEADQHFQDLLSIYKGDLTVEIMPHEVPEQKTLNLHKINLANNYGVPIIATCDAHYPTADWFDTYKVSGYIRTNMSFEKLKKKKEEGKNVLEFDLPSLYLMTDAEVKAAFKANHPEIPKNIVEESIRNTHEFTNKFTPFFVDRTQKMPDVKSKVDDPRAIVMEWVQEGLKRIGKENDQVYLDRLQFEIDELDTRKDVYDYFYIVGEAVRWAKAEKIRVGLGRGSAAGCLVSYCVGITNIDPIAYGLLFERFLNPNRKGMPDIDIDFSSRGRQKVKDHLAEKYGSDHVADIVAHSTLQPKAAIRKVSTVYDIPFAETLEVTKTIDIKPDDEETTLEQLRPINSVLDSYAQLHEEVWKHALRLEGSPAVTSKHAAGLIITDKACKEFIPLERSKDGGFVTAFNDAAEFPVITEYLNVMKFDFLGIKGLDEQELAIKIIEERTGKYLDLDTLPILSDPNAVDPEVMKIFSEGKTLGIWQFSGSGITSLLRQMKPDSILDLVAANALYRPGPMEHAFEYGERKNMPADEIDYWHPSVKRFLEETRGIVAYQEQVMQVAQELGGLSPGDADDLRKAMGKLYRLPGQQAQEFMQSFKDKWDAGFKSHNISDKLRDEIWAFFLNFGNYAFNKSHSASYAIQAYQDGVIKKADPLAKYAAMLTMRKDDKEIRPAIIRESRTFGVQITPPDINDSDYEFSVVEDKILYGLTAVKGIGDVVIKEIRAGRPFISMEDFQERMRKPGNIKIKSNVLENLIKCGAFDRFGVRDGYTDREKGQLEKEVLGISISGSMTLEHYKDKLAEYTMDKKTFDKIPTSKQDKENSWVQIAGEVVNVKPVRTKKDNKEMAIVIIAAGSDEYKCTIFPAAYKELKGELTSSALIVQGYKDRWQGNDNINVIRAMDLEEFAREI